MTHNSTATLRAALDLLAEQAPTVDALDQTAWRDQPGGGRPRRRLQLAAIASTVAVVAALVVGIQLIHHGHGTTPASSGRGVLEVRPLVAPGVSVPPSGGQATDPLQALTFPIPSTEAAYDRLSPAQQQQLRSALASTDCDNRSPSTAAARVACGPALGGSRTAYLLGPALFGNAGIKSAAALEPPVDQAQWTVSLMLRAPAAAALARFTTAHHTSGTAGEAAQCGPGGAPCGDYLGFVVNGSVVSLPITLMPINGGAIQISGNLDKQSATALAQELNP